MSFTFTLIISVISIVILSISGGYATAAAVSTTFIDGFNDNDKLKSAHTKLSWSAAITWIIVALIIVLGIVFIININAKKVNSLSNIIIYSFIALSMISTAIVGILSAIAASEIQGAKVQDDKGSHRQATIAAILAIIGFAGLLAVLIFAIVKSSRKTESQPVPPKTYYTYSQPEPETTYYTYSQPRPETSQPRPQPEPQPRPQPTSYKPFKTHRPEPRPEPRAEPRPEPPRSRPENCPAYDINPAKLECKKRNLLKIHPDKNIGCPTLATTKFTEYKYICNF